MLIRKILAGLAVTCLFTMVFFAWQHFDPVTATPGWSWRELAPNVRRAAALAQDTQGQMLVSEELRERQGTIMRISPSGQKTVVVSGLSKPDGLATYQGALIFSQESGLAPVQQLKEGQTQELFQGRNLQSLSVHDDHLFAIEDLKKEGRLFRYNLKTQELQVLRQNLDEAGAFAICPDGRQFYAEKDKGTLKQLMPEGSDPVRLQGLNQPGSLFCDTKGLWISEDANHRARLLLWTTDGALHTILSSLKSPQNLHPIGGGRYWLAEGGRNRVLELALHQEP